MKDDRFDRIGISSGGERCSEVVMKCLLDGKGWKPKIYFVSKAIFLGKIRALDGKKQESDESQEKNRHRGKGLQQHCGK